MRPKEISFLIFAFAYFSVLEISNTFHLNQLSTKEEHQILKIENSTQITDPVENLGHISLSTDDDCQITDEFACSDPVKTEKFNENLENLQSLKPENSERNTDPVKKQELSSLSTDDDYDLTDSSPGSGYPAETTTFKPLSSDEDRRSSVKEVFEWVADHATTLEHKSLSTDEDCEIFDEFMCPDTVKTEKFNEHLQSLKPGNLEPNINSVKKQELSSLSSDDDSDLTDSSPGSGYPGETTKFKPLSSNEDLRSSVKEVFGWVADPANTLEHNSFSTSKIKGDTAQINFPVNILKFSEDENRPILMTEKSSWMNDPVQNEIDDLSWEYRKFCTSDDDINNVCMSVGKQLNGREYPKRFRIRKATEFDEIDIDYYVEDKSRNCKVRKDFKTAEILCYFRPTTSICKSHCVYGHTYEEGIARLQTCSEEDGKWNPPFEECKPFVDCGVKLNGGGTLKCVSNHIKSRTRCLIACDWDDIDNGVPPDEYVCNTDGSWKPPLPFCAELKGVPLVKAPEIREHKNVTFPY